MTALMRSITRHLYFQVLIAIVVGGLVGWRAPELGSQLKPIGDGFISLVKMLIGPIIFCTVVMGISSTGDLKKVGRVGAKALIYFEVISSLALVIGLAVGNILKPGAGFNVNPATLDASSVAPYTKQASEQSFIGFVLHIIPKTFVDAFTGSGDLLQVLVLAVLFGWAMNRMGESAKPVTDFIQTISKIFFSMMNAIMKLAPVGAGCAMAFTLGEFGTRSLSNLMALMGSFYLTCLVFMVLILAPVSAIIGFNFFRFIHYIREELILVLSTSSSESALVPLMEKLERLGCSKSVVGLVVPAGYSFNLDGTNIYLTLAVLFVAQALNIDLTLQQQLTILGIAMLTSKGASGVTGAGFITLAATLAVVPQVPVAGLALILGVDRFMSEARALTNIIGNGVATLAISSWEGELHFAALKRELSPSQNK